MKYRGGARTNICQCDTCRLYGNGTLGPFSFDSPDITFLHYCDLCKKMGIEKSKEQHIRRTMDPMIITFFEVKWICWECAASIDFMIRRSFKQCYAKISYQVMKFILCKWLRGRLILVTDHGRWQQSVITTNLRKGEKLPPWATAKQITNATQRLTKRGLLK